VIVARRLDVEARFVREHEQRSFGRVADDLAVHELGVVGDDVGQNRALDRVR
jgi:hypothetical protein